MAIEVAVTCDLQNSAACHNELDQRPSLTSKQATCVPQSVRDLKVKAIRAGWFYSTKGEWFCPACFDSTPV